MHIRLCTINDYPAVVTLLQHYRPSYTIEAMHYEDDQRDPKCKIQRWITEYNGEILAYAMYAQNPHMYHPRKFQIAVLIHPHYDFEDSQISASTLYDHVIAQLQPLDPISAMVSVKDDVIHRYHIDLLKARGFQEVQRQCSLSLNVPMFDFTSYVGTKEKLLNEGIEIKTFKELEADPNRNHKLHALENEIYQDMPFPEQTTAVNFDYFVQNKLNSPNFLPEAYFVAIHGNEYIGLSSLEARSGGKYLFTSLTGVKRFWRRKGVALSFKLCAISHAKSLGHAAISTICNTSNKPIYELNKRLGFIPSQVTVLLKKVFH